MTTHRLLGILLLFAVLWVGCTPEPKPIPYGEVACAHCKMTVTDPRYGAELVTTTGKTYMFDAIECLAAYVHSHPDIDIHSLWVTAFRDPGTLVRVENAFFVQSDQLKSPMALNVAAFPQGASRTAIRDSLRGQVMDWPAVRDLIRKRETNNADGRLIRPGDHPPMHRPTSTRLDS